MTQNDKYDCTNLKKKHLSVNVSNGQIRGIDKIYYREINIWGRAEFHSTIIIVYLFKLLKVILQIVLIFFLKHRLLMFGKLLV